MVKGKFNLLNMLNMAGFVAVVGAWSYAGFLMFNKNGASQVNKGDLEKVVDVRESIVSDVNDLVKDKVEPRDYKTDDFPEEDLEIIKYTADRVGIDSELLMAIRKSENGREGLEFGIIPTSDYNNDKGIVENKVFRDYKNEFEKQASWCAWTIKKNKERFENVDKTKYKDFIDFLGDVYCPVGAKNDPKGLNKHWEKNVRHFYDEFKD